MASVLGKNKETSSPETEHETEHEIKRETERLTATRFCYICVCVFLSLVRLVLSASFPKARSVVFLILLPETEHGTKRLDVQQDDDGLQERLPALQSR